MNFSAVILAGGQSSRMGRDKAWLPAGGETLLSRQLNLLRVLGPTEVFISGRSGVDYTAFQYPVLTDRFADAGPLAGIERALDAATAPLVMVLAVDMPAMTAEWLEELLSACTPTLGVVPAIGEDFEPLAAVYPKACHSIIEGQLEQRCRAAREFAQACITAGLVRVLPLPPSAIGRFANWNCPQDFPKHEPPVSAP